MRDFKRFIRHLGHVFHVARGVFAVLLAALLGCALVFVLVEDMPFGEAIYLTLITGLTVGYGDVAPATPLGRVAGVLAGVIGVIYVGMVVAIASGSLARTLEEEGHDLRAARGDKESPPG